MTKIIAIGDTHNHHRKIKIEPCDILIHAGDWTSEGKIDEVEDFAKWLNEQPANDTILIPGNHERYFARVYPDSRAWILDHCPRANLLIHEALELKGIKFFGSPYTPAFGFDWAYNAGRTPVEAAHLFKPFLGDLWKDIPKDTQFLINHGMPYGILDDAKDWNRGKIVPVGDQELLKAISGLPDLKYYVGGHLHAQGGKSFIQNGVTYHNLAICDDQYRPTRKPTIIEYS